MIKEIEITYGQYDDTFPAVYEPTVVLVNHIGRQNWKWCRFCPVGTTPRCSVPAINLEAGRLWYWDDNTSPKHCLSDAITMATFFDVISFKYPEFAEWLLFHPEWF